MKLYFYKMDIAYPKKWYTDLIMPLIIDFFYTVGND